MTSIVIARAAEEKVLMDSASSFFDVTLTPHILRQIKHLSKEQKLAWWAGFSASLVGAMMATVGERRTEELCEDLFQRASDFTEELRKAGLGVCSALDPTP